MPKIFILTEGGKDIGFGHIARCLSLKEAFAQKNIPVHFIVNADSSVRPILKGERYRLFNWLSRKADLFRIINGADIIFVDSYLAGPRIYKKIAGIADFPVFLDDNKRLRYPKGVVINPAVSTESLGYDSKKNIRYLLGPSYMYLRKEFQSVPKKKIRRKIRKIIITFGGDDKRGMTPKVLKFFKDRYPNIEKRVIIGKAFTNPEDIKKSKDRNIKFFHNISANKMKNLMLSSDIAVTACGQTLQELARMGIPSIGISTAENQLRNAKGWQRAGFIKYIGNYNDRHLFDKLEGAVKILQNSRIRRKMSKSGKALVDGKGSLRIVEDILSGYYRKKMRIRKAFPKDARDIFALSKEKAVKRNSFGDRGFGWAHHLKWFRNRLKDNSCVFLAIVIDGDFAGQVRFDVDHVKKEAIISLSLSVFIRGLKLASLVLEAAIKELKKTKKNIKRIKAYVKKGNVASVKSFKKTHFVFSKNTHINGKKAGLYVRRKI